MEASFRFLLSKTTVLAHLHRGTAVQINPYRRSIFYAVFFNYHNLPVNPNAVPRILKSPKKLLIKIFANAAKKYLTTIGIL